MRIVGRPALSSHINIKCGISPLSLVWWSVPTLRTSIAQSRVVIERARLIAPIRRSVEPILLKELSHGRN